MSNFTKELRQAIESGLTHKVFRNVLEPSKDFDIFFDYIEKTKVDGNYRSDTEGFYILNGVIKEDLYKFQNAENFENQCADAYEEPIKSKHGFSIVISELVMDQPNVKVSGIMKHTDPHDTIHWDYIGESLWNIYDENGTHQYHLMPGDVIYVSTEVHHEVHSITKRAGIIFCAG